jgi:hypothetical protein
MTPDPADDRFEATFVLRLDRAAAWARLVGRPLDPGTGGEPRYWLAGFDSAATVTGEEPGVRLAARKDDQPCAGTDVVVTLADDEAGTRITVVQSGFGDWLAERPGLRGMMAVGWRNIVSDLAAYLWSGAHAGRHALPWGDLGAEVAPFAGGLEVAGVRPGTLAERLGLRDGDLLVMLANAPVSTYDDLVTVLRVLGDPPDGVAAAWIRDGELRVAAGGTG